MVILTWNLSGRWLLEENGLIYNSVEEALSTLGNPLAAQAEPAFFP